jgi:hypothetical protein
MVYVGILPPGQELLYVDTKFTIRFKESLKFTKHAGNPRVGVLGLLSQRKFYHTFG